MSTPDERHPILVGLGALGAVAVAVGLVIGIVAIVGSHVAGVGGGSGADAGASLYVPSPQPTTATPDGSPSSRSSAPSKSSSPNASKSGDSSVLFPNESSSESATVKPITLVASPLAASAMQTVTLSGTYPGGEGAIVQVQHRTGGAWSNFPIPGVAVTGGRFTTYIQTGQAGPQSFRMIDSSTGQTSNAVQITIG